MYRILFTPGAQEDLDATSARHQKVVIVAIEEQLQYEPTTPTRHRKPLPSFVPDYEHVPPIWQLSVGDWRVHYDVAAAAYSVFIRRIFLKPGHQTTTKA